MAAGMKITGMKGASNRLDALARRAANPEPALERIQRVFEDHVNEAFETNGASNGRKWKPLSARYFIRKRRMSDRGPLELTGGLRESFTGGRYRILRTTKNRIEWGSRHPLGHLHQDGTAGHRVPARPMAQVTVELRRKVKEEFAAFIMGNTKR